MKLQLVRDVHGYVSVLGEATTVDPGWVAMQSKRPSRNPVWHSAYPLDGGAVCVDLNKLEWLGEVEQKHIDSMSPSLATDKVIEMWENQND
mgnify:CR=1 FL=1